MNTRIAFLPADWIIVFDWFFWKFFEFLVWFFYGKFCAKFSFSNEVFVLSRFFRIFQSWTSFLIKTFYESWNHSWTEKFHIFKQTLKLKHLSLYRASLKWISQSLEFFSSKLMCFKGNPLVICQKYNRQAVPQYY